MPQPSLSLPVTSYSPIGEDSLALRLESQLSDLRAVNANLRCCKQQPFSPDRHLDQ